MLHRHVEVPAKLGIRNLLEDVEGKTGREGIQEPDPFDALDEAELFQKFRKDSLPIQVEAVISAVLRDDDQFLHSEGCEAPGFKHDALHRFADMVPPHQWNRAE